MTEAQTRVVRIGRVKFASPDAVARLFEGTASTARLDRAGDILEPQGAEWTLPVPLLLDHNHAQQIGHVKALKAGQRGIRFTAEISRIEHAGKAKDLVDFAWNLVQAGLRGAVSVGFRSLASEPLRGGGVRYTRWELLELSLVSIPAQPDALIDNVAKAKSSPLVVPEAIRPRSRKVAVTEADYAAARKCNPGVFRRSELARIARRLREIEKAKAHVLRMDELAGPDAVLISAHTETLRALERERETLIKRQTGIRAGLIDPAAEAETPAPETKAAPDQKAAAWDIQNLPQPPVPDSIAMMPREARQAALDTLCDYQTDRVSKLLSAGGTSPDEKVTFADVSVMIGKCLGAAAWSFQRCAELEARVAAVEERGLKYLGTYQRASDGYKRGSVVTFAGSAWVALKDVPGDTAPGVDPACWQLMVKAGKDGRDAR